MSRFFFRKIGLLLALMISGCFLLACHGAKQEDAFPNITHYTVPTDNSMRVTLYFPTEEPSAFSTEVRQIELPENIRPGYAVVEQLIKGPQSNLLPACPAGYTLNSVWIIGRVAYIDLHHDGAEAESLSSFRAVAARTLAPVFNTEYVLLTVNGKVPAGLTNGLERSSDEKETNSVHLLVYYPDETGTYLIPKPRAADKQTEIWVSAFSSLVFGNEPEGTKACFDDQIKVTSGRMEADTMYVDFYVPETHASSDKCYAAMAQTLLHNTSGISRVVFTANGKPIDKAAGMTQTPGEFTKESLSSLLGTQITTYFANENHGLTAVRRAVPLQEGSDALTPIYKMLEGLQGGEEGLSSVLPEGIEKKDILGIKYDHNTAMLNLSENFFQKIGLLDAEKEEQLVYALVNALTDHGGIDSVVILQNGKTKDVMVQCIVIAKPLLRNPGLIHQ